MKKDLWIVRFIVNCLLFGVLLFGPWWLFLIFGFIGVVFFSSFYEFLLFGIFIDTIYGAGTFSFKATFFAFLVFIGIILFKKLLRKDTMSI